MTDADQKHGRRGTASISPGSWISCFLFSHNQNICYTTATHILPKWHEVDLLSQTLSIIYLTHRDRQSPRCVSSPIGGSGVRVTLLPDARERYHRCIISYLGVYGVNEQHNLYYPANSPLIMYLITFRAREHPRSHVTLYMQQIV